MTEGITLVESGIPHELAEGSGGRPSLLLKEARVT